MAEVRSRGQMILLSGVVLAVLFVVLALLVNTAIYTDNVATRDDGSASEALEYQSGVVDSVGELLDAENANDSHATAGDIEVAVGDGTDTVDETHRRYHLRRGAATEATLNTTETVEGRLLRETDANEFGNWTANASAVRGFVIELDTAGMSGGSPFTIDLDGTELDVAVNETGTDEVVITGGTENADCSVPADGTVRFDVTGERLGGEPCRFGWPELDGGSRIGIENAENGSGTYEVTVASGDAIGSELPAEIATVALYSVGLDLRIETPDLEYERTVRVAPGEPDG